MPTVLYVYLVDLSIIEIIDGEAITINEGRSRGRDRDTGLCRQKWEYPCWEVEAERPAKTPGGRSH